MDLKFKATPKPMIFILFWLSAKFIRIFDQTDEPRIISLLCRTMVYYISDLSSYLNRQPWLNYLRFQPASPLQPKIVFSHQSSILSLCVL